MICMWSKNELYLNNLEMALRWKGETEGRGLTSETENSKESIELLLFYHSAKITYDPPAPSQLPNNVFKAKNIRCGTQRF